MQGVESAVISAEVEQLAAELEELRGRVDEDNSSFVSLEKQIESLKQRLRETQDAVLRREEALVAKRAQMADAQRLQRLAAYDEDLANYRATRDRGGAASRRFPAPGAADGKKRGHIPPP